MKRRLANHCALIILASLLLISTLALITTSFQRLQNGLESNAEEEAGNVAWQYSLLLAEYHRFDHQLDRTLLLRGAPQEVEALRLRYTLLKERIEAARAVSRAGEGRIATDAAPFLALAQFIKTAAFLHNNKAASINVSSLQLLAEQFAELPDKICTLALTASRLTGEAGDQKRRIANDQLDNNIALAILILLLACVLVLLLRRIFRTHTRDEQVQNDKLLDTRLNLTKIQNANQNRVAILAGTTERLRLSMVRLEELLELMDNPLDTSKAAYLQSSQQLLRHVCSTIEDEYDLARLDVCTLTVNQQQCKLHKLLHETLDELRPLAHERQLGLFIDITPAVPSTLTCDTHLLRKLLLRLFEHAISQTKNGRIALNAYTVNVGGGRLKLEISDMYRDASEKLIPQNPLESMALTTDRQTEGEFCMPVIRGLAHLIGATFSVTRAPGEGNNYTLELALSGATSDVHH